MSDVTESSLTKPEFVSDLSTSDPSPVIRYYTSEQLSPNQEETPERFLLLRNVPIARTGALLYLDKEMPWIEPNEKGFVHIERLADDVFAPNAIASFNGKPLTNDHPPEKVTPENYKRYSVGTVLNPRRGDGDEFSSDILYADILVKDADAIKAVKQGKRQISAGYDARYTKLAPGLGQQTDIIGNHVALVDKGRCGDRCSIMDHDKESKMTKKLNFKDRLLSAFYARDEDAMKELVKDPDMLGEVHDDADETKAKRGDVHVHVNNPSEPADDDDSSAKLAELMDRVSYLEEAVVALASGDDEDEGGETGDAKPAVVKDKSVKDKSTKDDDDETEEEKEKRLKKEKEEEEDKKKSDDKKTSDEKVEKKTDDSKTSDKKTTTDSSALSAVFQDVLSRAEILAPGIRHPTFDAAVPYQTTMDTICDFRRQALAQGFKSEAADAIKQFLEGKEPDFTSGKMTCDAIATIFQGASTLKRSLNNASSTPRNIGSTPVAFGATDRIKKMNERYKAYFDNQK